MAIELGLEPLTRAQLIAVARQYETITLSHDVLERLTRQRAAIDVMVESGTPVYGLSTGFGALATTFISPDQRTVRLAALLVLEALAGLRRRQA